MAVKVCLITGATGFVGQYILNELVASGRKVLALGDSEEAFAPLAENNRLIKATSALPISAAAFKEHNVQFCFGDVADISFLASIFNTASKAGIEIEFVLHLAAVKKARRPVMGDGTANLLEVCRAYWQSNPEMFKGFFYAAGEGDVVRKFSAKDGFPVKFYQLRHSFAENNAQAPVKGENLYRLFTPVDIPFMKKYQERSVGKTAAVSDNQYIKELSQAVSRLLNSI